jgi:predicted DNA-binding transcriptional regulator AlpA
MVGRYYYRLSMDVVLLTLTNCPTSTRSLLIGDLNAKQRQKKSQNSVTTFLNAKHRGTKKMAKRIAFTSKNVRLFEQLQNTIYKAQKLLLEIEFSSSDIPQAIETNSSICDTIRQRELIKRLPFSAATLWRKVKDGSFPVPIKLSKRITAWRVKDVSAWFSSQDV